MLLRNKEEKTIKLLPNHIPVIRGCPSPLASIPAIGGCGLGAPPSLPWLPSVKCLSPLSRAPILHPLPSLPSDPRPSTSRNLNPAPNLRPAACALAVLRQPGRRLIRCPSGLSLYPCHPSQPWSRLRLLRGATRHSPLATRTTPSLIRHPWSDLPSLCCLL